jgi:hypothetical protein
MELNGGCATARNSVEFLSKARHGDEGSMRRIDHKLVAVAGCVAAALWPLVAPACNVPVFRFALERWAADPYQITVFHASSFTSDQEALVQALEKRGREGLANLTVSRADLTQEMPPTLRALWNAQQNPSPPWMVVRYPKQTGIELSAWAGPLRTEAVRSLVESPARRELAQKLLSGDAVVWLLLESGDSRRNDEALKLIEAELRKLEKSLVLPERSPLDPPINPDLPLKIAFSTVRVARSDPAEGMLVNMLLNWNTNLTTAQEPMLFPIFGRGRAVSPAIGEEIRPEAIREMAEFLTGPCSCEVKTMNPGYDLLLAANWTSLPGYEEVVLPPPPPLVGMSQLAAGKLTNLPALTGQPAVSPAAASASPARTRGDRLVRNVVIFLGMGVTFLALATIVLKRRTGRTLR